LQIIPAGWNTVAQGLAILNLSLNEKSVERSRDEEETFSVDHEMKTLQLEKKF
jgi:hypothetical protein